MPRSAAALLLLLAVGAAPGACAAQPAGEPAAPTIPARAPGAIGGAEFARRVEGIDPRQRQAAAVRQLTAGNLPQFLRQLVPVRLTATLASGEVVEATIRVMPDYLAIGSDSDFLRMPLTYPSAVAVAARLGMVLPTRKIVDAVYEQATVKLEPRPMTPGPRMRSVDYYRRHQETIERQRGSRPLGALTAGHKKDVVITNRLRRQRGRIAIYGWHRARMQPIQPLSLVHGARYADYSHGVRLVHPTVEVGGEPRLYVDLLRDPVLAVLLSYEGPIPDVRRLLDPAAVAAETP